MAFISYAQNFEDVLLRRALKNVAKGFYIDVGAAWPDMHSVTKAFYLMGWRGVNIEPNPEFYSQLLERRPQDINVKAVVSDQKGEVEFNLFPETGLSTLDGKIAQEHIEENFRCEQISVSVFSLCDIWESYVPKDQDVHFLKIDVEGLEGAVLKGNDWLANRPWIVLVESTLPLSQVETHHDWEFILTEASYSFAYADGLNRFYVDNNRPDLLAAFKYPPNVFDEFVLVSEIEAEARAAQLQFELMALVGSKSWSITKPLREAALQVRWLQDKAQYLFQEVFIAHSKVLILSLLYNAKTFVDRSQLLKKFLHQGLNRFPGFKIRLLTVLRGNAKTPFIEYCTAEPFNTARLEKLEKIVACALDEIRKEKKA